jgi:hypothetical protein
MTAHARALDLAGAAPAFRLAPAEERELTAHLRGCPDCARCVAGLRADAFAIGRLDPPLSAQLHDRIREVAVTTPRRGPSALGIVVIVALLAVGAVGASIGVGAWLSATPAPKPLVDEPGDVIHWSTDVVELAAKEFYIDAGQLRFTGTPSAQVDSDPGTLEAWTLEVSWPEQGREQRLYLYFGADDSSWWIDEVRVYDGAPGRNAKWATFPGGPWARTPLGRVFDGDLDIAGTSATGPVKLHLGGLRIAVRPDDHVTAPIGGGIRLQELPNDAGNPFRPGGALHCSGILQLTPLEAEARLLALGYALSWRWQYSTGANTGYAEIRDRAPETGWITDAGVGSSGELIVFVADPARPFGGPARDLPEDCSAPSP